MYYENNLLLENNKDYYFGISTYSRWAPFYLISIVNN